MRILAADLGPERRGGQRQTALLCVGLAARGHEVRLAARRDAPLMKELAGILQAGTAPATLSLAPILAGSEASPVVLWQVGNAARAFRPDIVYAGDARAHGALAFSASARRRPLVVHRRVVFPPGRDPFSRWKYRTARAYFAVSDAVRTSLIEAGVPARKITVIADGLPPSAFLVAPSPPETPFRLVHVGAFDGRKGQSLVVKVVARLTAAGRDIRALFLGEGPERGRVEAETRNLGVEGRCEFPGSVSDVSERLARSHLLLLPSDSEGAPLALVEAMAAGCPVLAHDVGGAREMIGGGGAGRLLSDLDPAHWEREVNDLIDAPRERAELIQAGRLQAAERRLEKTIDRIADELGRLVAAPAGMK